MTIRDELMKYFDNVEYVNNIIKILNDTVSDKIEEILFDVNCCLDDKTHTIMTLEELREKINQ